MGRSRSRKLTLLFLLVLAACSRTAEEWSAEGVGALKAGALSDAARHFEKALELNPAHAESLYGRGWVYYLRGDFASARVYFERCLDQAPEWYGGYKGLGSVHLAQGYYEQAEAILKEALKLKPGEPGILGSLGYVYLQTRRLGLAEQSFQEALTHAPGRGELHTMLAELRARQGRLDDALLELALGFQKPMEEQRFKMLARALQGQLLLQQAVLGMPEPGGILSAQEKERRLGLLRQADDALNDVLKEAAAEDKQRYHVLKRKVQKARERLEPPPL